MHRRTTGWWTPLALVIVLGVAACTAAPATPTPAPTTAPAAPTATAPSAPKPAAAPTTPPQLTHIAVSYPDGGAHLPLFIARDKGIFQKYGLDVELKGLGGGPKATSALLGGDVQLVDITGSEIVSADVHGANVEVLATLTPTYPYVFEVSKDITNIEDLKGKTIAVRAVGDATDVATRVGLKKQGLNPDTDVTILAVDQEGARMASLESGQICCTVAQVSDRIVLEQAGFHMLFDLTNAGLPNAQGVIAAKRDYIDANPQVVQNFTNALIEGIAMMKADKNAALPVLKNQLQLDDDAIASATYDFFAKSVVPSVPLAQPAQFADTISLLAEKDPRVANFDISKYIDSSYVNKAVALGLNKAP